MPSPHHYALILAGGRGTRFWPRSRTAKAKQVLEFVGEGSLIQQTVARLKAVVPAERIWVLTSRHLRAEIVRQLPEVPKQQILAEPVGRNTAPAIGLAARILHEQDPDAVMGVFSADHYFEKPAAFLRVVRAAYRTAAQGSIALLGIHPKWPETGYGYVEFPRTGWEPGSLRPAPVVRFREKPDLATATRFVKAGHFAWNSGIFFWRADVVLAELHRHLPQTAALLASLPSFGTAAFPRALQRVFPACENVSIDYAVLEKASGVVGFATGDIGWNDVGSWNAVHELLPKDEDGNVFLSSAVTEDAKGNFVDAPGKLVALVGVEDLVVVDTGDALLVCRRSDSQKVSALVKRLEQIGRNDLL